MMTLFDFWFLEEVCELGWSLAVEVYHRSLRHQQYLTNQIIEEIELEDRLDIPEGLIAMTTLYGEGD